MKKLGIPIIASGPEPLELTPEQIASGFGWNLSPEAQRDIDAIEKNRRMALHRLRNIIIV